MGRVGGYAPGLAAGLLMLSLYGLGFGGLAGIGRWSAEAWRDLTDPYVLGVLRFSLLQALLSTLISLAVGAPLALALARRRFPGRELVLKAMTIGFVTPVIVAALGIIAVHGRGGWVNQGLGTFGLAPGGYLYGLPGILIAHVLFNAPLAARVYLQALEAIPTTQWRLAEGLGMGPGAIFRLIDRPVLLRETPGLAALIFLLCFTSFATVLTLGGGPGAQTLEVAIYQALAFELDFNRALVLSALQIAICLALALLLATVTRRPPELLARSAPGSRPDAAHPVARSLDHVTLMLVGLILLPPALAVVLRGLDPEGLDMLGDPRLGQALLGSLKVAVPAGILALALGMGLAWTARHARSRGRSWLARVPALLASVALVAPPFVLAAGLFASLRGIANPLTLGPILVPIVNGVMATPFVYRLISPALDRAGERNDRLCQGLGITGWTRLWLIDFPSIRGAAALALGVATAFSLGDFGLIALFGSRDFTTLPLLVHQLMGSYRLADAGTVALVLMLVIGLVFWIADRLLGGRERHA